MKQRIDYIDIAKGIAILLVMAGHSSLHTSITDFIFAFHMPFFFMISGVTTNYDMEWKPFIAGKVKHLLLPFLIYSVIVSILQCHLSPLSTSDYYIDFLCHGWKGIALWFVPVLFIAQIVTFFISKLNITHVCVGGG